MEMSMGKVDKEIEHNSIFPINRTIIKLVECFRQENNYVEPQDFGPAYIIQGIQNGMYYVDIENKKPHNAIFDRIPKKYLEERFYKITCSNANFITNLDLNKDMFLSGMLKNKDDISMTQTERNFLFQ